MEKKCRGAKESKAVKNIIKIKLLSKKYSNIDSNASAETYLPSALSEILPV